MSEWSESWMRECAGWRAMKEGKSLVEAGRVSSAEIDGEVCRGSVREGNGLRRVTVRRIARHEVETRCGCAENRASGAMCGHAVAVVLAAIRGSGTTPDHPIPAIHPSTPQQGNVGPHSRPTPLRVEFSPRWQQEWAAGRLNLKITADPTGEGDLSDAALAAWLAGRGIEPPRGKSARLLAISGPDFGPLLEALRGMPRISCPDGPVAISTEPYRPLIRSASPRAGLIRIEPIQHEHLPLGGPVGGVWMRDERTIRATAAAPSVWPDESWLQLNRGQAVELPVAAVLAAMKSPDPPVEVESGCWLSHCRVQPVTPRFELKLRGDESRTVAELFAQYGEQLRVPVASDTDTAAIPGESVLRIDDTTVFTRSASAELAAAHALLTAGFQASKQPGSFHLHGHDATADFVASLLPELRSRWSVVEDPAWSKSHRHTSSVRARFVPVRAGHDWFSFDVQLVRDNGQVLPPKLAQQLLLSKGRSFRATDGSSLRMADSEREWLRDTLEDLNLSIETIGNPVSSERAPLFLLSSENVDKPLISSELQSTLQSAPNESWKQSIGNLWDLLRGYQQAGFAWLVESLTRWRAALLADDMGLGKTIQTIAWIRHLIARNEVEGAILVICPTSLLGNWREEWGRFGDGREMVILHGAGREERLAGLARGSVAVTSYGSLVRDRALHLKHEYAAVVLDEASMIRNPDSEVSRCVAKLRAGARLALTGTPVENRLADLWAIFRFLKPGYLGSREWFRERYEVPCGAPNRSPAALRRLRDRMGGLVLRRTKEEVAADLPPKVEVIDWCGMSTVQQAWYGGLAREGARVAEECRNQRGAQGRMKVLTALLRLRQACCDLRLLAGSEDPAAAKWSVEERSGKLARLVERVREAVDGEHRVLVFSQFATMLAGIREVLRTEGFESCLLDGSTRDRSAEVARFRSPDGPPVFLISLKAGGYGLNLPEADVVIHYDPWWNPAVEAQASDRAHRIGQTKPVTVYKLLTRGTVEELVLRLQEDKRQIASGLLRDPIAEDGTSEAPTGLAEEELLDLLQPARG